MPTVVLIAASLSLACGLVVGLVVWPFASLTLALGVGAVISILTFFGLLYLAIWIASEVSPDDAVDAMSDWLASPLECGERPASCSVVFEDKIPWPLAGTRKQVFLCRYAFPEQSENPPGIGIVGPMIFSFLDLDWDAFTHEQLVQCYRGLHLAMLLRAEGDDRDELTKAEQKRLSAHLTNSGYTVGEGSLTWRAQVIRPPASDALFAVPVSRKAEELIVVGDLGALEAIETRSTEAFSVAIAHYHWLDCWWLAKQRL